MTTIERKISVKSPPEKVFSYITNPLNQTEMNPSIKEIKDITGKDIGQRWRWMSKIKGFILEGEAKVVEFVPNARYVTKTEGDIISTWSYSLKPQGSGTRLDLTIDYTFPIPIFGIIGEMFLSQETEQAIDTEISNIKNKLER